MTERYPETDRSRMGRIRKKVNQDVTVIHAILDEAKVGHLAISVDGEPRIVPTAFVRDGQRLLIHGSTGAGILRAAIDRRVAFSVTLLDGYVLARSAFESSMHYRSVVVHATARAASGDAAELLTLITDKLFPGRAAELRPMLPKEIAATLILEIPLEEVSCKVSNGQPDDPESDIAWPVWAGIVPLHQTLGAPIAADNLLDGYRTPPDYLAAWK